MAILSLIAAVASVVFYYLEMMQISSGRGLFLFMEKLTVKYYICYFWHNIFQADGTEIQQNSDQYITTAVAITDRRDDAHNADYGSYDARRAECHVCRVGSRIYKGD